MVCRISLVAFFSSILVLFTSLKAAESEESALKTAFIYNFMRYIVWPDEQNKKEFKLVYLGESRKALRALDSLKSNNIRNKSFLIRSTTKVSDIFPADVVFVDQAYTKKLRAINAFIKDKPVLVISENAREKQLFGINFIKQNKDRIGFEVNRYNLLYQKLKVSSDIVILGGTEIEIASMVKEMEADIDTSRTNLKELQQKVDEKQTRLDAQSSLLDEQASRLAKQQADLEQLDQAYSELNKVYSDLNDSLENSRKELNQNNELLGSKQVELEQKAAAINDLSDLINKNKQLLIDQSEELERQRKELALSQIELEHQKAQLIEQQQVLAEQSSTIKTQATALYGSIVLILSVIVTVIVIYRGFKLKQRSNLELEEKNRQLSKINHELTETQGQLVEAEKMAALGGLVAGVAHEINTPIGVGVTSATHLLDSVEAFKSQYESGELKRSQLESLLEDLSESGEILNRNLLRASELIRSFKQVSTDQTIEEKREFNLAEYIGEICQNLHHKLKQKHHQVEVSVDESIMLNSYPGALAQVFTNLIVNSIIHGFGENENGQILIHSEKVENERLKITYNDYGKGIPTEEREKIFDPFFTTNRAQGGTGLGLHICYNLVTQKLGGKIKCLDSEVGASFEINLPYL
ncbi:MAG: YfiR/HmsC family protein [Kangiellaceae bacterium]|nr:YfiR/HmsC family protein [Kangiellaceae bacterium]